MLLKLQTTHPFDMNAAQIDIDVILDKKERNLHPSAAKLLSRRDTANPETTLAELVRAIKKRLPKKTMLARQWEDLRNQFDESAPDSKKTFNDFLSLLQKESFYRDTLAEAQIFKQSCVRLSYTNEIKFLTQQQVKIQNEMSALQMNSDSNDQSTQPSFSYLIVDMITFHFQGTQMLICTNEQGNCQLFDCESGVLQHEFIFDQSFGSKKKGDKKKGKKGAANDKDDENLHSANQQTQSCFESDSQMTGAAFNNERGQATKLTTSKLSESGSTHQIVNIGTTTQISDQNYTIPSTFSTQSNKQKSQQPSNNMMQLNKPMPYSSAQSLKPASQSGKSTLLPIKGIKHEVIPEDVEEGTARSKNNEKRRTLRNNNSFSRSIKDEKSRAKSYGTSSNAKFVPKRAALSRGSTNDYTTLKKLTTQVQLKFDRVAAGSASLRRQTVQAKTNKIDEMNESRVSSAYNNQNNYMTQDAGGGAAGARISLRSRQLDDRRRRIKIYDEESKETIQDHLRKQKVTQKLGLDFHIFVDEDSKQPQQQQTRSQTTKASSTSKTQIIDKQRRNNRASDTMSQMSTKHGKKTTDHSPNKRHIRNSSSFGIGQAEYGVVAKIDAYKARKEPIPFGMSEKIWDLDSYKDNFDKFQEVFGTIKRKYDEDESRLKEIRAQKASGGETGMASRMMTNNYGKRLSKQDSNTSFNSNMIQPKKVVGGAQQTRMSQLLNEQSSEGGTLIKSRNQKGDYQHQVNRREKQADNKKAYIPMIKRDQQELVAKMCPMDRFRREMFLLHEHPDALTDITHGIRADQQKIAQTLQNNQLLVRILEKQRDRYHQWQMDVLDEERKDPREQRLPSIECINFDKYEETYEERNQQQYDYMRFYQSHDVTIGQIMENHTKKNDKDGAQVTRKLALKTVKPSRPMYMTYYEKKQLVIFALLGEVKIVQVKQNGQKKTFQTMCHHMLEDLPVGMDVGSHKLNGKLMIFVACQYFTGQKLKKGKDNSEEKNYVSVIEVDQENGWKVQEKKRIYPDVPQITKIIYKKNYGLIMACYRGYIEHFDGINFKSVNKWHNNMKAIGSEKLKLKAAAYENKKKQNEEFEGWIAQELQKKQVGYGGQADQQVGSPHHDNNMSGHASEVTFNEPTAKPIKKKSIKQQRIDAEQAKREEIERKKANLRAATLHALKQSASEKQQVQTINCIDYSADLYLIAFGGVHGQIGVLDSTTMSFIGMYDAHGNSEVSAIYFYKKERQMISISLEGDCAVWDAQKMVKVQTIRNKEQMKKTKHISTSIFDQLSGSLMLATSEVFRFEMHEDHETKIQIDQQLAVAANYLQQMKQVVDRNQKVKTETVNQIKSQHDTPALAQDTTTKDEEKKGKKTSKQQVVQVKVQSKIENSMQIVSDLLNYKKLPQMTVTNSSKQVRSFDKGSYTVLPSCKTRLIGCFVNIGAGRMFTIDIDCLIRQWDLLNGLCVRSYPLEKPSQPGGQTNMDNNLDHFKQRHQIQAVQLSPDQRVVAVAFQGGFVQLNNIYSGCVMYNKAFENQIDLGPQEISNLAFFHKQTNYWVAATLWDGKVAFLQRPLENKGTEVIREKKVDSRHLMDVICLDITETNHMATCSLDHSIIFWNSYNAQEGKRVQIPADMLETGSTVQSIRFAFKNSNDFLFVFMSNGDMFILETQSETFIEPPDFESNKVIKPYSFGRIPKEAVVDIKRKRNESKIKDSDQIYVIGIGFDELSSQGTMYIMTMADPKIMAPIDLASGVPKRVVQRRSTHKKAFSISDVNINFHLPKNEHIPKGPQSVVKVELFPDLNIFILSQVNGVVGFYDIRSCELISYINQETPCRRVLSLISGTVSKQRDHDRQHMIDQFSDSDEADLSTEDKESAINQNNSRHVNIEDDDPLQSYAHNAFSPAGQMMSVPQTAKNGQKNILSPGDFRKGRQPHMLSSADGGDYDEAEEMGLSDKINNNKGSATRNTFGGTTRTKNTTTPQAWTSDNGNSPKQQQQ